MVMIAERDIHILRYFSAFISVSEGKVINVTDPQLTFCPLAGHLYKDFKKTQDGEVYYKHRFHVYRDGVTGLVSMLDIMGNYFDTHPVK